MTVPAGTLASPSLVNTTSRGSIGQDPRLRQARPNRGCRPGLAERRGLDQPPPAPPVALIAPSMAASPSTERPCRLPRRAVGDEPAALRDPKALRARQRLRPRASYRRCAAAAIDRTMGAEIARDGEIGAGRDDRPPPLAHRSPLTLPGRRGPCPAPAQDLDRAAGAGAAARAVVPSVLIALSSTRPSPALSGTLPSPASICRCWHRAAALDICSLTAMCSSPSPARVDRGAAGERHAPCWPRWCRHSRHGARPGGKPGPHPRSACD